MKHCLLVEKDRGNTCRKNQGKKISRFLLANFLRGLNFYGAGCTCHWHVFAKLSLQILYVRFHQQQNYNVF
jgi:hypothetical protein